MIGSSGDPVIGKPKTRTQNEGGDLTAEGTEGAEEEQVAADERRETQIKQENAAKIIAGDESAKSNVFGDEPEGSTKAAKFGSRAETSGGPARLSLRAVYNDRFLSGGTFHAQNA